MQLLRVLTTRKIIVSSLAGVGYRESKTSERFVRSSFYGHMRSRHGFPHEGDFRWVLVWVCGRDVHHCPIFRGGWGDPRFEQLVLGWMDGTHGTVGKVPQYFDKTTWGGIWSSQINTGARHGKEMAVKVVHKVRDTWQGHEVAYFIASVQGLLPW